MTSPSKGFLSRVWDLLFGRSVMLDTKDMLTLVAGFKPAERFDFTSKGHKSVSEMLCAIAEYIETPETDEDKIKERFLYVEAIREFGYKFEDKGLDNLSGDEDMEVSGNEIETFLKGRHHIMAAIADYAAQDNDNENNGKVLALATFYKNLVALAQKFPDDIQFRKNSTDLKFELSWDQFAFGEKPFETMEDYTVHCVLASRAMENMRLDSLISIDTEYKPAP